MPKNYSKQPKTSLKLPKGFRFFCIFLQTKIFTILMLEKTKRNNDENKQKKIKNI